MSGMAGGGEGLIQAVGLLHEAGATQLQGVQTQEARLRLGNELKMQQVFADMGKAPGGTPGGAPTDPLARMSSYADSLMQHGLPLQSMDMIGKIATARRQQVTMQAQQTLQQLHALEIKHNTIEQQVSMLRTATDEPSYQRLKLIMQGQGEDTRDMPQTYVEAKPMIDQMVQGSVKVTDALKLQGQQLAQQTRDKAQVVSAALASAKETYMTQRLSQINQEIGQHAKNGGTNDPTAAELKKARTNLLNLDAKAKEAKLYPPVPATPVVGQVYTGAQGQIGRWEGTGWDILTPHAPPTTPNPAMEDQ